MKKNIFKIFLLLLLLSSPVKTQDSSSDAVPNANNTTSSCKNFFTSWGKFKECAIQWGGNTAITIGIATSSAAVLALMKCCRTIQHKKKARRIANTLQPQQIICGIKTIIKNSIQSIESNAGIVVDLDATRYPEGSYINKFAIVSDEKINTLLGQLQQPNQLLNHLKQSRGIILIYGDFMRRSNSRRTQQSQTLSDPRKTIKNISNIFFTNNIPFFVIHVQEATTLPYHFTIRTQTIADVQSSKREENIKIRGPYAQSIEGILYSIKPSLSLQSVLFTEVNKALYVRPGVAHCFMKNFLQQSKEKSPAARTTGDLESGRFSTV